MRKNPKPLNRKGSPQREMKTPSSKVFISKGLVCVASAFVVCVLLFYFMAALIAQDPSLSQNEELPSLVEFIQNRPRDTLKERKRKLPKKPQKQKKIPKMQLNPTPRAYTPSDFQFNPADFSEALKEGLGTGEVSQSLTPLIRVDPHYPVQARLQGIEGQVWVRFDVSPSGTTVNIKVVDSRPPRVFDRASIQAVRKWKYSPQQEDGKPIFTRGEGTRFDFTLDN